MKTRFLCCLVASLVMACAVVVKAKDKDPLQRGMLVKMASAECGFHEKGVTGVGSVMASAGVERVTSEDKLCPEYLLRTDTMEYRIRPVEKKHPALLPVGHEGLFRVGKDRLFLRMADEDSKRMREYQVVSATPISSSGEAESGNSKPDEKP